MIKTVTITGADDTISPAALIPITKKYPFVEWGILFSISKQGTFRYPCDEWLGQLCEISASLPKVSAHLCGKYARDFVLDGELTWFECFAYMQEPFSRVQLNIRGQYHMAHESFGRLLHGRTQEIILQHAQDDTSVIQTANLCPEKTSILFDRSGGLGILPGSWPAPIWKNQGYAGGLGPENVEEEVPKILSVSGDQDIWIDMESKVRTNDRFDLEKVEEVLAKMAPFVRESA